MIDRKKDILTFCNYHISPSEIEGLLINHPAIKQVCVVGIPDADSTDLPAAVVIRNQGACISEEKILNLVSRKCIFAYYNFNVDSLKHNLTFAEKLSDHKRLRGGVYFVDKLPMTPSGKIVKRIVKEMAIKFYNERHHFDK